MNGEERSLVPGIETAGTVICPILSMARDFACKKGGCEWWVELNYGKQKVARCSIAWISKLSTEIREAIDRGNINGKTTEREETVPRDTSPN